MTWTHETVVPQLIQWITQHATDAEFKTAAATEPYFTCLSEPTARRFFDRLNDKNFRWDAHGVVVFVGKDDWGPHTRVRIVLTHPTAALLPPSKVTTIALVVQWIAQQAPQLGNASAHAPYFTCERRLAQRIFYCLNAPAKRAAWADFWQARVESVDIAAHPGIFRWGDFGVAIYVRDSVVMPYVSVGIAMFR